MISKSQIKLITGLQQKKYRDKNGLFIAEGRKVVNELHEAGVQNHMFFSTNCEGETIPGCEVISERELKKISTLKTPNSCLGVFEKPTATPLVDSGLIIALDAVRDPGNLGTIIRLCDWFGVAQLICSEDTTDCYAPKVVQATMGSIARVSVHYLDLKSFLKRTKQPVFVTAMKGANVYETTLPNNAIVVMGNESHGVSQEILDMVSDKITIPQFGAQKDTESLNVATATAIILSEFRRTTGK